MVDINKKTLTEMLGNVEEGTADKASEFVKIRDIRIAETLKRFRRFNEITLRKLPEVKRVE